MEKVTSAALHGSAPVVEPASCLPGCHFGSSSPVRFKSTGDLDKATWLGVATMGHATSGNSPMRSGRRGLEDQLHHAVFLGPASSSGSVSFPLTLTPYFHFQS